jgi:hypothetical protein
LPSAIISGVPTQGDFGDNPIKVTAIDAKVKELLGE